MKKSKAAQEVLAVGQQVNQRYFDPKPWLDTLPRRKRRVAELLFEGWSTCEIAREMGVTPGTIRRAKMWLFESARQFRSDDTTDGGCLGADHP